MTVKFLGLDAYSSVIIAFTEAHFTLHWQALVC